VDAATGEVAAIEVGGGPVGITTGNLGTDEDPDRFVWVTHSTDKTLWELDADPPYNESIQTLLFRPGGLAFGEGSLWIIVAQADAVDQIDAARLQGVGDPIEVGAGPVAVGAGGGAAWVSNSLGQSLSRIPATLGAAEPARPLDFTPGPLALDPEGEALWIIDTDGDAVVRYDTTSRSVVAIIEVGRSPVGVAVGAGSVWVANESDGTVSRIDPATNTVIATIAIGGAPQGIAVSDTTVWVAVAEP
jgi:YVTN family beta-propeller protein